MNTFDENLLPFNCTNETNENRSNKSIEAPLYKGKIFNTWQEAFDTIESWAKKQGFNVIYNRVIRKPDGTFRKRTVQCEHQGDYVTKSTSKQTTTKRIGCTWHINLSEPIAENSFNHVYITTFHNTHSHNLNPNIIQFGDNKQIPLEIMKEIEFLTVQCKMGASTQRQYLEAKFPGQIIYNNDLYCAIQYFRPQSKNDTNDAAKLYTRLLESSLHNPMWKVAIKFDDNNTLTHLFWMSPSQLELWYQFSDIVVQDVTCKTNRYDMALNVNKEQISSMWAVSVGNKLMEKHFIILLTNGSHYCSCLSLINRGIVCRHYFQIMLRSSLAKFHLRLIPSRWYYKNKDPSKEPFLVANKFEDENAPIIPESNIPFLAAVNQTTMPDSISNHERLTDIQLYGKITGLTHKVTMKAIRNKDIRIIDILENYLQDENENVDENMNNISEHIEDLESDKENNSSVLKNPNRQTKPKGRPKGTKRLKAFHEKTNTISSGVNKQYKCGNCGNTGHNKRNCDQT
ncbi:hypothetical protein Glove_107g2 [Diversispora epigaea]|uniref:CCHC-type domain-containing protein n=1 Tax=Diversispora epigaea TaxID=1348612 RepID=A0A397J2V7_9GLOM|nr:hypothetical protein Glove_107g2 [Diversispora epigaea]